MELTPAEIKLIEERRAAEAARQRKLDLCYFCIDELKRWKDFSLKHECGLTFSTLVNQFYDGHEPPHGFTFKEVYAGISTMIKALDELHG